MMIQQRTSGRAALVAGCVALAAGLSTHGCDRGPADDAPLARSVMPASEASEFLAEHRKLFDESVERFQQAPVVLFKNSNRGFANTTVLEAPDGLIVVDTNLNHEDAAVTAAKMDELFDAPVIALIYTHHHADHTRGSGAFVDPERVAAGEVPVIASEAFPAAHLQENAVVGPIMGARAMYMYGALLPEAEQADFHVGCCGRFRFGEQSFIDPTRLVGDGETLELGGLELQFFLTGGESASHMVIWLPEYRVMLVGDELQGPAFPNLHSLRGTAPRNAQKWIDAIDRIRSLEPELLLPGHGPALAGGAEVDEMLTTYRDAIQYTHDQTIRLINRGYTQEELARALPALPAELSLDPWTKEVYGTVKHSVRSYYTSYVSWFSGDPVDLDPTPPIDRATRSVALMGGRDAVLAEAQRAMEAEDPQWAAELATLLVRVDREDRDARLLKAEALRHRASETINTNWRGFYLTAALELEGAVDAEALATRLRGLVDLSQPSTYDLLSLLRYRVKANEAMGERLAVGFVVTDRDERFTLELRNGILDVRAEPTPSDLDAKVSLDRRTLEGIFAGEVSFVGEQLSGNLEVEGLLAVRRFFGFIEQGLAPVTLADH